MYFTFGQHAKKSPEEVIKAAKKQKLSEEALDIATSPFTTLIKKGVKTAVGEKGQVVSEEQFIKAVVLKTLKDVGLLPKSNLKAFILGSAKPKKHKPKNLSLWNTYLNKF